MKTRIAVRIERNSPAADKLYNFHPAFIYAVWPLLGLKNVELALSSDDQSIVKLSELYGINCRTGNFPEMGEDVAVYDPSYPLVTAASWHRIIADLEKGIRVSAPFLKYPPQARTKEVGIHFKDFELFNCGSEPDSTFIDALIRSDEYKVRPFRISGHSEIIRKENPGKPKLLFSAPYAFFPHELRKKIESDYDVIYAFNASYHQTKELLIDREIWLTGTAPPYFVDKEIILSGKNLKIVATPSTGTNHLDVKAAADNGVIVCSIKTADFLKNIHASSEHTFALLLAMIKKIPFVSESARNGIWREEEHVFRSIELNGRTIGIIGYGRIGGNLARYCHSFGMKVLAYDPFKNINDTFVEQVSSKEDLLERSDIVSVNYHLTPDNHGSFGKTDFEKMKPGSYFLNTARGELVDEHAMIEALKSGKLKAAAVDVISNESGHDKWDHPVIAYARKSRSLLVTPHTAGLTVDSESKAAIEILREIERVLRT